MDSPGSVAPPGTWLNAVAGRVPVRARKASARAWAIRRTGRPVSWWVLRSAVTRAWAVCWIRAYSSAASVWVRTAVTQASPSRPGRSRTSRPVRWLRSRRARVASGSAASAAARHRARNRPGLHPPAAGSSRSVVSVAVSGHRWSVSSHSTRALARSIRPSARARATAGTRRSRPASTTIACPPAPLSPSRHATSAASSWVGDGACGCRATRGSARSGAGGSVVRERSASTPSTDIDTDCAHATNRCDAVSTSSSPSDATPANATTTSTPPPRPPAASAPSAPSAPSTPSSRRPSTAQSASSSSWSRAANAVAVTGPGRACARAASTARTSWPSRAS